ncbi:MAG: FAD-dependent monooxygenase [Acidobacteriota bacterium]
MSEDPYRVAVVGGSVGGLAAALELRRNSNAEVAVYERSAGHMQARGAGVVMQPEVEYLLEQHGTKAEDVCVRLQERIRFTADGRALRQRAPQLMTAWDALYRALREPLGDVCYRQDSELVALEQDDERVDLRFADGYQTSADFLVAADGVNSQCRAILVGEASARYTGYVAWRGLENESDLPETIVRQLADRFTFFHQAGMQLLCYLVPGADGGTTPGERRVNWVWYINTPDQHLPAVLTGASGRSYRSFVPAGDVNRESEARVHELADRSLPPVFRDLVHASELFLQPVQDVAPQPRLHGRCALIGDAAGTVRPHTASGTSKAFADATLLAVALRDGSAAHRLPMEQLEWWQRQRQGDLVMTAEMGMRLAAGSGLGVEGAPQPWVEE